MSQAVRPIPENFTSVTPYLTCEGADKALAFYQEAFGAVEVARMASPEGKILHAEIRIGNAMIMLSDDFPEFNSLGPLALKGSPVGVHLYVEDADAAWHQALAAGATPLMPLADAFWGDRFGMLVDPFGHRWSIATHVRDMTPAQIEEAMKSMPAGCPEAQP